MRILSKGRDNSAVTHCQNALIRGREYMLAKGALMQGAEFMNGSLKVNIQTDQRPVRSAITAEIGVSAASFKVSDR